MNQFAGKVALITNSNTDIDDQHPQPKRSHVPPSCGDLAAATRVIWSQWDDKWWAFR